MQISCNPISLANIVAVIIGLNLLMLMMFKEYRKHMPGIFPFIMTFIVLWDFFGLMLLNENDPQRAVLWARLIWSSVAVFGPMFLHLALLYPKKYNLIDKPLTLAFIYGPMLILAYFIWSGDMMIAGTVPILYKGARLMTYGPILQYYAIYACIVFLGGLYLFLRSWISGRSQRLRSQGKWMFFATLFPAFGGTITNIILPSMHMQSFPLAAFFSIIMCLLITYAMIKYKFEGISPSSVAESLISMLPHIVILVGADQKIVFVNKKFTELLGYTNDEVLGKHVKMILAEDSLRLGLPWQKVTEGDQLEKSKVYLLSKNKEVMSFIFSGTVTEQGDELVGLVGVGTPAEAPKKDQK